MLVGEAATCNQRGDRCCDGACEGIYLQCATNPFSPFSTPLPCLCVSARVPSQG